MIAQIILMVFVSTNSVWQEPERNNEIKQILAAEVLQQEGKKYSVSDVLEILFKTDASLEKALLSNITYFKMYVNSQIFFNHVRWFSNNLILNKNNIPSVNEEDIVAEAMQWAKERGMQTQNPQACVAQGGLEVLTRARLINLRPQQYSTAELRTHFNRSIPEFAGRLKIKWIRLPLFNSKNSNALSELERKARYDTLNDIAQSVLKNETSFEEAVKKYCEDPITNKQEGAVGYITRTDTRFEEEMRRQLFSDLGFKTREDSFIRGPILGESWIYLIKVETLRCQGVIELQRYAKQVQRSLKNYKMFNDLAKLASTTSRSILLPLTF